MSTVEQRIKELDDIRKTVKKYENHVNELLREFGWTKEKLPKYIAKNNQNKSDSTESSAIESGPSVAKQASKPIDLEAVVDIAYKIDAKRSSANNFTDLNKLRRDLKRRRVKYRTTKTAPLTYTEELRELIELQMELVTENKEEQE
ncbi:uncharacterized protein LOC116351534 [Contarinia nasturtii]|uniref:uncharacterized protein LOC116351534 n=1 Tax=Contarinia nasturtii TaxID=265458 RepID=UPI0012D4184C|nr:uncharacterized protein LOC116351534 [Contarinia nasturtii]